MSNENTEAEAVARIARMGASTIVTINDEESAREVFLTVNEEGGTTLNSLKPFLDEYRQTPERKRGTAILQHLDSFIAHANRFKDEDSAVFADRGGGKPKLVAVLDYHEAGEGSPRFGVHRSLYEFPLSDEWQAWHAQHGKVMEQAQFSEFLETRLPDIGDPEQAHASSADYARLIGCEYATGHKLLEVSRGLSLRVGQSLKQKVNLGTGETQFEFVEEHSTKEGGPLKVPGAFLIAIPVFRAGERYQIPVRLRYRVQGSGAVWYVELARASEIFDDAFERAARKAEAETELPLFFGLPE